MTGETIAGTICATVPHRQLVFTIPERLRFYCRHDRRLLGKLSRAAWQTAVEVYRQVLGRRDALPGMVAGIQTFGELINFHPHIHAIATDGVFTPDGTFLCLPRIDKQLLLEVWKNKVFELFVSVLDFLAEVTQHIPERGEHLVRYFGWYSHRQRGIRKQARQAGEAESDYLSIDRSAVDAQPPAAQGAAPGSMSAWAMLIKRVYEVDELECRCCGGQMKIVSVHRTLPGGSDRANSPPLWTVGRSAPHGRRAAGAA